MAYTKHTWETGEVITSAKLNNIEEGVKSLEPFFIEVVPTGNTIGDKSEYRLTKTYNEIYDAVMSGKMICTHTPIYNNWDDVSYKYGYGEPIPEFDEFDNFFQLINVIFFGESDTYQISFYSNNSDNAIIYSTNNKNDYPTGIHTYMS